MTTTFSGRRTPMPRLTPPLQGWLPTLADLGVPPLVLLIPGIRRAALQPRLTRGQELVTPVRGPRRRDPQFPRHRLEILAPQQAEYRRACTPGRTPPPPVTLGGRSSRPPGALRRRRFLNLLPHLDTPSASTRSQSSVQEHSRAQEPRTAAVPMRRGSSRQNPPGRRRRRRPAGHGAARAARPRPRRERGPIRTNTERMCY